MSLASERLDMESRLRCRWQATGMRIPLLILVISLAYLPTTYGEAATQVQVLPGNRRGVGEAVTFVCKVRPRWSAGTVHWWRRTGDLVNKIGENSLLRSDSITSRRYSLSKWGGQDGGSFRLTIDDLKYEDSAQIGCSVLGSDTETAFSSLAVCDDVETFACQCIVRMGWMSPDCFERHPSIAALERRYNMLAIGLGVCLGIAVIYGIAVTVLAGLDCMGRIAAKRKRQMELAKMRSSHNPSMYEYSEEVQLDPNDTSSSQGNPEAGREPSPRHLKEPTHPDEKPLRSPRGPTSVAHANPAFSGDDDGSYQEIDAGTPQRPRAPVYKEPGRRYPNGSASPAVRGERPMAAAPMPSPSAADKNPYQYGSPAPSPSTWHTDVAPSGGAVGAYYYPEPAHNRAGRSYPNGDLARQSPAVSAAPTSGANRAQGERSDGHLDPRQLYTQDHFQQSGGRSPGGRYADYQPDQQHWEPSGAYIDKTDTVI